MTVSGGSGMEEVSGSVENASRKIDFRYGTSSPRTEKREANERGLIGERERIVYYIIHGITLVWYGSDLSTPSLLERLGQCQNIPEKNNARSYPHIHTPMLAILSQGSPIKHP